MPIFLKLIPLLPFSALCLFTAGMRLTHEAASVIAPAGSLQARPCLTVMGPAVSLPSGSVITDSKAVMLTVVEARSGNRGTQYLRLSNGVTVLLLNTKDTPFQAHQQIGVRMSGSPAPHHGDLPLTQMRMAVLEP